MTEKAKVIFHEPRYRKENYSTAHSHQARRTILNKIKMNIMIQSNCVRVCNERRFLKLT